MQTKIYILNEYVLYDCSELLVVVKSKEEAEQIVYWIRHYKSYLDGGQERIYDSNYMSLLWDEVILYT